MIAVCGEALIDFTPLKIGDEQAYVMRTGGSPYNVAIGLARLGKPTAFIGKMSDDRFGAILRERLSQHGVDLRWLARGSDPTALAFVIPDPSGAHNFAFYGGNTAEQNLVNADIPDALPDDAAALHFGSYSLMLGSSARTYERLLRRESGARVISLDPNVRPALFPDRTAYRRRIEGLLPFATLVKVSDDDLAWLYPGEDASEMAARWLKAGPSLVVVTRGAAGAIGMTANITITSPGVPVEVEDSVGAGDAFMASLLARLDDARLLRSDRLPLMTEQALADALTYANRAAALTCARSGADPPNREQIERTG